jgi:hypothetical protein
MASGDAFDLFISYTRSDENAAAKLNGCLFAQSLRIVFDRSGLGPGLRSAAALEDASWTIQRRRVPRWQAGNRQHPANGNYENRRVRKMPLDRDRTTVTIRSYFCCF